ncbi:MAG: lipase family protein [Gammaproteobacteria bacterium]|nr:lipase family protein [Gammaproteobacteria bacterium]
MNSVEPYRTTLSKGNAYWMARIAKAVYLKRANSDEPDKNKILEDLRTEDPKFRDVIPASKNSAQAALIEHDDYICLAFRGTDQIADWLDNTKVFQERALFGGFHRGFWNSLHDVWTPLFDKYQQLRDTKKRPLFLTGHSLGGAMAAIGAAKLIHQDLPFMSVYTFGQPRAMTLETARIFNVEAKGRFFRFQNNNDIVTRVPGRSMGYSHVGSFLYISEEEKISNDPGLWYRFLDSLDGAVGAARETGIDAIEDHDMSKYMNAVIKWDCDF